MIPVFRPSMGEEEIEAVAEVLRSGWIGLGPKTEEFEQKFAEYIGIEHAVALNSCTSALQLALKIRGITKGEVITTPISFVSTAHAILYNGAKPVFADVQEDTLNIDPEDIEKKITDKTVAIIPVHYAGHPCDMDEIMDIGIDHDLDVIEDAAHACGAEYKGSKAGSIGTLGCFSFHAVKNLATGDGGMITTPNKQEAEELKRLRWLGASKSTYNRSKVGYSWFYDVESVGFKMHSNDIASALGLVQLRRLDNMNDRRNEIAKIYDEELEKVEWIETPIVRNYVKTSRHIYAIRVKTHDRNKLIDHLAKSGISTGVHYIPLYLHKAYQDIGITSDCPVTDRVWTEFVTLPMYPDITDNEVNSIITAVKGFNG